MNVPQGSILIPGLQIKKFCKTLKNKGNNDLNTTYSILELLDKDLSDKVKTLVSHYINDIDWGE